MAITDTHVYIISSRVALFLGNRDPPPWLSNLTTGHKTQAITAFAHNITVYCAYRGIARLR